jgi:hypothetical protein
MNQPLPPSELRNFHTWQEVASDKRLWISLLRRAMFAKSKGFRLPSMKNTGRGEDRRKDKLEGPLAGVPKAFRSHAARYAAPAIRLTEKSARRKANLMRGK